MRGVDGQSPCIIRGLRLITARCPEAIVFERQSLPQRFIAEQLNELITVALDRAGRAGADPTLQIDAQ